MWVCGVAYQLLLLLLLIFGLLLTATTLLFRTTPQNKDRHVGVYGEELYASLQHFYSTVAALFKEGRLGGARIIATAKQQ